MKNRIKLTESQLHNAIKESVKKVLKENVIGKEKIEKNLLIQRYDDLNDIRNSIISCSCSGEFGILMNNVVKKIGEAVELMEKYSYNKFGVYCDSLGDKQDSTYEPEDWYERNEHGDFDNY